MVRPRGAAPAGADAADAAEASLGAAGAARAEAAGTADAVAGASGGSDEEYLSGDEFLRSLLGGQPLVSEAQLQAWEQFFRKAHARWLSDAREKLLAAGELDDWFESEGEGDVAIPSSATPEQAAVAREVRARRREAAAAWPPEEWAPTTAMLLLRAHWARQADEGRPPNNAHANIDADRATMSQAEREAMKQRLLEALADKPAPGKPAPSKAARAPAAARKPPRPRLEKLGRVAPQAREAAEAAAGRYAPAPAPESAAAARTAEDAAADTRDRDVPSPVVATPQASGAPPRYAPTAAPPAAADRMASQTAAHNPTALAVYAAARAADPPEPTSLLHVSEHRMLAEADKSGVGSSWKGIDALRARVAMEQVEYARWERQCLMTDEHYCFAAPAIYQAAAKADAQTMERRSAALPPQFELYATMDLAAAPPAGALRRERYVKEDDALETALASGPFFTPPADGESVLANADHLAQWASQCGATEEAVFAALTSSEDGAAASAAAAAEGCSVLLAEASFAMLLAENHLNLQGRWEMPVEVRECEGHGSGAAGRLAVIGAPLPPLDLEARQREDRILAAAVLQRALDGAPPPAGIDAWHGSVWTASQAQAPAAPRSRAGTRAMAQAPPTRVLVVSPTTYKSQLDTRLAPLAVMQHACSSRGVEELAARDDARVWAALHCRGGARVMLTRVLAGKGSVLSSIVVEDATQIQSGRGRADAAADSPAAAAVLAKVASLPPGRFLLGKKDDSSLLYVLSEAGKNRDTAKASEARAYDLLEVHADFYKRASALENLSPAQYVPLTWTSLDSWRQARTFTPLADHYTKHRRAECEAAAQGKKRDRTDKPAPGGRKRRAPKRG